tara:strand:- start:114 stop:569 length:456 start_codon:yes stop_codon:yes gene_type:complete
MISPLLAALIIGIGWGVCPIFEKRAMTHMSPVFSVICLGLFFGLFATIVFGTMYAYNRNVLKDNITNLSSGVKNMFIAALFAYFFGTLFFFLSLGNFKNTSVVILLSYTLPIIIGILLARMIFSSKINYMMALGMIITLIGLTITVNYKEN